MNDDMKDANQNCCLECGAPKVDGMDCWGMLGAIIAWEYEDPELLMEHFKTVASYNLQHPAMFTDEAIAGLRRSFIEHIDHGLPPSEIRKRTAALARGSKRVLRREPDRSPVLRRWPMTIADVCIPDRPQGAAQRVRDWARSIRDGL